MGDRYWLKLKCGDCGEYNPSSKDYAADPMVNGIYFAPSSGFCHFVCRICKKINWIQSSYAGKVVSKKELEEFYKKEGFE